LVGVQIPGWAQNTKFKPLYAVFKYNSWDLNNMQKEQKLDIHNHKREYASIRKRLNNLSPKNRKLINEFDKYYQQ